MWRQLLDRVIVATLHAKISAYLDAAYPDIVRSANQSEGITFAIAVLTGQKGYAPQFRVLQIPFCTWEDSYYLNLGTAWVLNYAHAHDLAVQYWTINDREDMEYLVALGADAVMSDYPDVLYQVVAQQASE